MKKMLLSIWLMLTVLVFAWFAMSYVEILCKKDSPNPDYSDKNIIVNVTEWANDYYGYDR